MCQCGTGKKPAAAYFTFAAEKPGDASGLYVDGESRFTSTVSNLGLVTLPEEMASHVERLEFMLGPSRFNPVNCGVISTGEQIVIQFSATMEETDPQRAFFRHLVRLGIPVRVESNRNWNEE